ncbi:MAG: hypothetical protein JXB30_19405 [Anaerolineae bacterium]|nr:hypothetical protein [Anaerolineae bacterium]
MADEPRFDWSAILRVTAIVVGVPAVVGLAIPPIVTLAFGLYDTGIAAGNEIYRWFFWVIAWGLVIWQGSWMLRRVGDKIIDDMLVMSMIAAVLLIIVRAIISIAYVPINSNGQPLPIITAIDAGGALMLIVVALIGARTNKF